MKADVLSLVQTWSLGQADVTLAEQFYRETVFDLGLEEWLIETTLIAVDGTPTIPFPAAAVMLLAVIYDDRELLPERLSAIQSLDPLWRSRSGQPVAYITEQETAQTFRLYPQPDMSSKLFSFPNGAPLGVDFPGDALVVVHTETRDDVLIWMEWMVVFAILAREYSRESDHRDAAMATVCQQVAILLKGLVS